jgi:hypothetical protein
MASNLVTNLQATPYAIESITKMGQYEDINLQIARGQIMGHSTVNIYGFQSSVTTSNIAVWENAAAYVFPTTATTMNLTSSVNTGQDLVATITIQGLNSSYDQISETLTLNGTANVATTNSYLRINSMFVASGQPTGIIYLKNSSTGTTYSQINAGLGRSQAAVYTVPAGYTFYLARINAYTGANGSNADYVQYRNQNTTSANVTSFTQQAPFVNQYESRRVMPRPFAEKTDIQLQAKTSANTYAVSISAEGYLVQNDGQALASAL